MSLALLYYSAVFLCSVLLMLCYVFQWQKHFDAHMTVMFALIPFVNLGYLLRYQASEPEAAVAALQFAYLGGCFLPWLITMCIASLCGIRLRLWVRLATLITSMLVYLSVLSIGHSTLFYQSMSMEQVGAVWVMHKIYGPLHTVHYVCLILYLLADMYILFYCYRNKKQVSRRTLLRLFIPIPATMLCYFANRFTAGAGIELVPLAYLLALVMYLLIAHRMVLYDVSDTVIESLVERGQTGFISFDEKYCYLGSNETAVRVFPELRELTVDRPITASPNMTESVRWLDAFRADESRDTVYYTVGESTYLIQINHLYDGHHHKGYQFFITDDTKNQQYIALLNSFNAKLQQEVDDKTAHIQTMNDQFILGMAAMVESRDNSTGGHIRRTSEGVRILTEAIQRVGTPALTETFRRNVIKAAPMHDLGKIAVDDAILRKPGRYTPEEYEAMKIHTVEGARVVREILQSSDDRDFCTIAENVAHYHHERWDGKGYPDGLRGEAIPLESRIMAVADVYDALVSRRVYKEKMSFAQADAIIQEGMGTQFDPGLRPCYEAARPALEAYYSTLE